MNIFDNLQKTAFNVVTGTMGYPALWQQGGDFSGFDFETTDVDSGVFKQAKILYKGPTEKERLANVDYDTDNLTMEYKQGDFDGLKDSVDTNKREVVRIYDIAGLWIDVSVLTVRRKFDGQTFEAQVRIKDHGLMP